tara:strand:- start:742 stop:1530 length:789 start_codon:yes stop_codon:yes gene_type:complete
MEGLHFNSAYSLLRHKSVANTKSKFYSTDDEKLFKKNVRQIPNWKWRNVSISYSFNSHGYRTAEFGDVNENFVLGFGCSYTEGVGINKEDIWLSKYCKELGIDNINLGKASSGMDIAYYNTLLWKNSKLPLPKLVVCQWPQKFRKSFGFNDADDIRLSDMSETRTPDGHWWGKRYIQDDGEMFMNSMGWYMAMNNTWQSLGVPVLNFTWEYDITKELDFAEHKLHFVDPAGVGSMQARDCMHDGPEFHQLTSEQLLTFSHQI